MCIWMKNWKANQKKIHKKFHKEFTLIHKSYYFYDYIFLDTFFSILFFYSSLLHFEKGKRVLVLSYNKFSSETPFLLRSLFHLLIIFNLIEREWDLEWLYHLENGHNLYPLQTKRDRLWEVLVIYTRGFQGELNWFTKFPLFFFNYVTSLLQCNECSQLITKVLIHYLHFHFAQKNLFKGCQIFFFFWRSYIHM